MRTLLVLVRLGWREVKRRRSLLQNCRRWGLLRVKGVPQQLEVRWDEDIPCTILQYIEVLFALINYLLAHRLNQFRVFGYRLAPKQRITFQVSAFRAVLL